MTLPSQDPQAARAKSQPQRVVDGVSERIRTGTLKPGDRVASEPELMREFGVSRTVVREAMSRLQASGLVETRQGVGTFVLAPPTAEPLLAIGSGSVKLRQVLAMLELRISLEAEAASLAALRRSDQHLADMRAALHAFDTHRREGSSTTEDDFRFHVSIAAATGNEYFEEVLRNLGSATLRRTGAPELDTGSAPPAASLPPSAKEREQGRGELRLGERLPSSGEAGKEITQREHEAIYEAIRRQDAAAARAAMFIHLSNSRERLRRRIGAD